MNLKETYINQENKEEKSAAITLIKTCSNPKTLRHCMKKLSFFKRLISVG